MKVGNATALAAASVRLMKRRRFRVFMRATDVVHVLR
jgi:hypothetical protein